MTEKPSFRVKSTPEGHETITGFVTSLGSITDTFEREFTKAVGGIGLKTPDGESLHVDDESITDLLKRTGGQ